MYQLIQFLTPKKMQGMRFDSQLEISEELLSSREELKGTRYYSPKLQQDYKLL